MSIEYYCEHYYRDKKKWGEGPWQMAQIEKLTILRSLRICGALIEVKEEHENFFCPTIPNQDSVIMDYLPLCRAKVIQYEDEPDKVQYVDEETGYPCLIVRAPNGALCGYVGLSSEHPYYKCDYDSILGESLRVHGGLTYSEFCNEEDALKGICHIPREGEEDTVWWLGFDCAHPDDYCPSLVEYGKEGEYRTIEFVQKEIKSLANQLAIEEAKK